MSDKSPRETPDETPNDDAALDVTPEEQDAPGPETPAGDADAMATDETDDEVIARLDEDLPSDEALAAGPAPIRRRTAQAPVKKAAPTRKRSDAQVEHVDPYKAKNPAHFVRQSTDELKKVVWPTWPTLVRYFAAVLIFVLFIIAVVALLDAAFGWALLQILGNN